MPRREYDPSRFAGEPSLEAVLDYEREDLAIAARREINARRSFAVQLSGEALAELHDLSPDGSLPDVGAMALRPKLRLLLAIWMLGKARGTVDFDVANGTLRFRPEGGTPNPYVH